jgi:hypothetical protein
MHYYRLSFKKVTTPDPAKPLHRKWKWYSLVCQADNLTLAREHGQHVAYDKGVDYVDAIRLLKVVGIVEIDKCPGFHEVA